MVKRVPVDLLLVCGEPDCRTPVVGVHIWRAADATIGVAYCPRHETILKAKLETAGRKGGGTAFEDLKN